MCTNTLNFALGFIIASMLFVSTAAFLLGQAIIANALIFTAPLSPIMVMGALLNLSLANLLIASVNMQQIKQCAFDNGCIPAYTPFRNTYYSLLIALNLAIIGVAALLISSLPPILGAILIATSLIAVTSILITYAVLISRFNTMKNCII